MPPGHPAAAFHARGPPPPAPGAAGDRALLPPRRELKLDQEDDFRHARDQAEQSLLAQRFLARELRKIEPTEVDLESYYKANLSSYADKKSGRTPPLEEIASRVLRRLRRPEAARGGDRLSPRPDGALRRADRRRRKSRKARRKNRLRMRSRHRRRPSSSRPQQKRSGPAAGKNGEAFEVMLRGQSGYGVGWIEGHAEHGSEPHHKNWAGKMARLAASPTLLAHLRKYVGCYWLCQCCCRE